jgi:DNA-binding response OmpR family regulator
VQVAQATAYHTHQLSDSGQIPTELRARKVDLVVTDLDMPEQQGLENVAALRTQHPNLKIIALSGLRIAGVPGLIVLPKPFGREVLLETVQNALVEAAHARVPVKVGRALMPHAGRSAGESPGATDRTSS